MLMDCPVLVYFLLQPVVPSPQFSRRSSSCSDVSRKQCSSFEVGCKSKHNSDARIAVISLGAADRVINVLILINFRWVVGG